MIKPLKVVQVSTSDTLLEFGFEELIRVMRFGGIELLCVAQSRGTVSDILGSQDSEDQDVLVGFQTTDMQAIRSGTQDISVAMREARDFYVISIDSEPTQPDCYATGTLVDVIKHNDPRFNQTWFPSLGLYIFPRELHAA